MKYCDTIAGITNNLNLGLVKKKKNGFRVDLKNWDWVLSYLCSIMFNPDLYSKKEHLFYEILNFWSLATPLIKLSDKEHHTVPSEFFE